ncbi:interference hedgehog [Scaptodrosophila lebanonensis]|uniref:Interference hedgehog n=1 Tax=Drosophila lebanonensis TaxID=7225 RepID=A0A6J2TPI5_DROLE|nr:interference hedgehog [Scaptodrosophila lebanonensis]
MAHRQLTLLLTLALALSIVSSNSRYSSSSSTNMVPPSRPNVTRLSDDAVMLRWNVPKNDGLPIQFFKVQYRMLGDSARKIPRDSWQTTNENISYGKQRDRDRDRDRDHHNHEVGVKNFTSSVSGLQPDRIYRFRIIAVYSNNDNKEGPTSPKFFLQRGAAKSNLPVPELRDVEPYSESAVMLHWTLGTVTPEHHSIDGYYAHYRLAASAGEYLKATVDGGHARKFKIDTLEPGTAYEFKLQSFNAHSASEFSVIKQGRTKKATGSHAVPTAPAIVSTTKSNQEQNSIYPVIAGAVGGGILLLIATVVACLCVRRRKNAQPEDENKPQLDHIQADFVTSAVLGVSPHHKVGDVRRLNGVIPRMNITPNPLAQDAAADKSNASVVAAAAAALHQPGLHHAQPYHPPATPTMLHKRLAPSHDFQHQQQPPPVPPHAAYYQQPPGGAASPMLDQHRRTLERSVRGLQQLQQQQQTPPHGYGLDEGLPTPTRIPSLRRQRRSSGSQHNSHTSLNHHNNNNNNNNNLPHHHQHLHHAALAHNGGGCGVVGIPIVPGSPRVQRSPMPARALIKRTRLGSHTDNISSGSLNSIEV